MKTIKKLNFLLIILMAGIMISCSQGQKSGQETEAETAEAEAPADEWIVLFDGESAEGWRGYGMETMPAAWVVEDGTLHIQGSGRGEAGAEDGGDIIYDRKFGNFKMTFEWKVSEGGNSGVFYLGQESPEFDFIWKTAPEYQVLDNERHPDAELGENGNRQSASLYDLYPADPQNAKPDRKSTRLNSSHYS